MIRPLARLLRLKLSLLNGIAAAAGGLLMPGASEPVRIAAAFSGVALLAAAGSALNQVLEHDLDRLMLRTANRPLPLGQLTERQATAIGIVMLLCGLLPLYALGGLLPATLGVAALLWYLAVYTPLKLHTPLALPIGALCGVFPPLIGWSLAGGSLTDFRIIFVAGLLFLWQVPHFRLLQRRHQDDYRRAGIPLFCSRTEGKNIDPIFRIWLAAFVAATLLLPAFGIIKHPLLAGYLAFPLTLLPLALLGGDRMTFRCLNLFPLLLSLLLLIQKQA